MEPADQCPGDVPSIVKMKKNQLRLLVKPASESMTLTEALVDESLARIDRFPKPIIPQVPTEDGSDDKVSRREEDLRRRQDMHKLITSMDKGSKQYSKNLLDTLFRGRTTVGPLEVLSLSIGKPVTVRMRGRDGLIEVCGTLLLFDRHLNILMRDVQVNGNKKSQLFIRGALIVFVRK